MKKLPQGEFLGGRDTTTGSAKRSENLNEKIHNNVDFRWARYERSERKAEREPTKKLPQGEF